jgi:DNA-binding response OmpR family regulator
MMVTAYGDDERRHRASDLGACEFLAKPVDFDALKTRLRRLSSAGTESAVLPQRPAAPTAVCNRA